MTETIFPLYSHHSFIFPLMSKFRITWVQVMAILALFGILLGVVGTAWLGMMPATSSTIPAPTISAEVNS